MGKGKLLLERILDISERYRVELKVFEVVGNEKYPEGVKARYALIDVVNKVPRLVVDNHAPFGFHAHTDTSSRKGERQLLKTSDYLEALDEFWTLAEEILDHEN